jgi:hypothetical protein
LEEFQHIDRDKGGTISKAELGAWLKDGKLGEVKDQDFNAMWVALDVDGNGEVDFVEFCTFLSGCGGAFDEVYKEQESLTKEEKLRRAARRLSHLPRLEGEELEQLEAVHWRMKHSDGVRYLSSCPEMFF